MIMNSQPHALALVAALLAALVVPPFSGVFTTVQAFSTGAGQCLVGQVSVGSPHLPDTQGDNGTLAGIAIEFLVDGTVVPDPSVPFALTPGLDHAVVLKATGKPLRGFLVAVSSPNDASLDLTSAIAPDTATGQIAGTCATPVVGITHKDNTDKTSVSGILRVDSAADLVLDITVVLQNSNGISSFGYTRFSASTAGVDTASPTSLGTTAAPTITPAPSTGPPATVRSPVPTPMVVAPTPTNTTITTSAPSPGRGMYDSPTMAPSPLANEKPSRKPTNKEPSPVAGPPSPTAPTSKRTERPTGPTSGSNSSVGGGGIRATLAASTTVAALAVVATWW